MMEHVKSKNCLTCGAPLRPAQIKYKHIHCGPCSHQKRIASLLDETAINGTFSLLWTRGLFKRLATFLQEHEVSLESQARALPKAASIFQEAEKTFAKPEEMSQIWLEEMIEKAGPRLSPSFFRGFLIQEQFLSVLSQDEKLLQVSQARIAQVPQGYQRLIEVFFQERLSLRERQIKNQAKKPLSMQTVESDLDVLIRLVRWLLTNFPELTGWEMVQENHINAFLLTHPPVSRELARRELYQIFRVGRKRRVIAHVPIMYLPSRKLPSVVEPLKMKEQRALARLIQNSYFTHPEEAFLAALCFYHGLSSVQIGKLKIHDIDLERGVISVENRPPVYLLTEDLLLLEQFLRKRQTLPSAKSRSFLFISNQKKPTDGPVGPAYIKTKLLNFTGFPPQRLWISCFSALAALYGPQYLVETFGLSLNGASRYGNLSEFLLEEEVKQQKKALADLL